MLCCSRQGDFIVGAELVVVEDMLGGQYLVAAVGIAVCRVLEPMGVLSAGPAIIVTHVGA